LPLAAALAVRLNLVPAPASVPFLWSQQPDLVCRIQRDSKTRQNSEAGGSQKSIGSGFLAKAAQRKPRSWHALSGAEGAYAATVAELPESFPFWESQLQHF